jgi:hypothetical protein
MVNRGDMAVFGQKTDGFYVSQAGAVVGVAVIGETRERYVIEYYDRRSGTTVRQLVFKREVRQSAF